MLAVVGAYLLSARRFPRLWHPVSILVAVATVSVVVAVSGEVLFGNGWPGAPAMFRRSAVGGIGWGLVIAPAVWIARRGLAWWTTRRAPHRR
jgi:hypothetical protein